MSDKLKERVRRLCGFQCIIIAAMTVVWITGNIMIYRIDRKLDTVLRTLEQGNAKQR